MSLLSDRLAKEICGADLEALIRRDRGEVSRRFITDPDIYRLELERIFARCWVFVAHESEIARADDFVTRMVGEDPVIVSRDSARRVHVLLNSCRHRGVKVTEADAGSAPSYMCPYHGWTYSNTGELIGVPSRDLWDGVVNRAECGLLEARVDTYHGLIFASWNEKAPTLSEYLGDIKWYLDLVFGTTDQGLEIVGPPYRWTINVNWKVNAGNLIGDTYHLMTLHRMVYGQSGERVRPGDGHQVHTGNGHGVGLKALPLEQQARPFVLQPEELIGELERRLSPVQQDLLRPLRNIHGAVFPNLGFFDTSIKLGDNQQFVTLLSIRQLQPKGPDKHELLSWCLVPKAAAPWWKDAARKLYVAGFGPAGTIEQDDTAVWTTIAEANRGVVAQRATFHYGMGLAKHEQDKHWPGPGVAYPTDMTEANERAFIDRWISLMREV